jgi:hypothetical protein
MANDNVMVVEELTGQKRRVDLMGSGLPATPAAWEGTNMVETTWYPGNGIDASQQVLGPRETPSAWAGHWSRTKLGRSPANYYSGEGASPTPIVSPIVLRDIFDSIRISGALLRVTWTRAVSSKTTGGTQSLVRVGRLTSFKMGHGYADDVDWEMLYTWKGRGTAQRVVSTRNNDVDAALNQLAKVVDDFVTSTQTAKIQTSRRTIPQAVSEFTLGQLEALFDAPQKLVDNLMNELQQIVSGVKQLGDITNKARTLPFTIANSVIAFCVNTMNVCNQFVDEMSRRPPEANTLSENLADLTRGAQAFGHVMSDCQTLIKKAKEIEQGVRKSHSVQKGSGGGPSATPLTDTILAVHVAKEGDTIPKISIKYYKVPDHAADICKSNALPWHQVDVQKGRTLIIPVVNTFKQVV